MKKFSKKIISIILSVAIVLVSLPLTVFAMTNDKTDSDANSSDTAALGNIISDIYELTDRRDEYTKHFRLEDGSVVAARYNDPIHYLDETGNWQDIDNTLSDIGSEYSTSDAKIKFAKKITGNENLFTLHDGNSKITMSLDGAIKKTEGYVVNCDDTEASMTKLQKMMSLEKISANIIYEDILDGVDLEYIVRSDYVKENIIVKEKQNAYSYSFTLKLNNLEAVLNEDGSISIIDPDAENVVYAIPAPVVYDDNYSYAASEAAYYSLTQTGSNKYRLTVTVDSVWMNAQDRAYPVIVDPTVYKGGRGLGQMRDTFVSSKKPTTGHGGQTTLRAGYDSTYGYTRSYVYLLPIPTLPKGSYLTSAHFNLQIVSESISNSITLAAYTIDMGTTSVWSESGTNWNTHSAQFSELLDYISIGESPSTNNCSWNVTEAAKKWYAGTLSNQGICIGLLEETGATDNYVIFHASESSSKTQGTYLPFYSFTYVDAKGIEDYYAYLASSVGIAGTSYVNYATGNMVLTKPLISTLDSLMPYTVSLTYNSALAMMAYKYSGNIMAAYASGYSPYGFKLNFQETLIKKSYINSTHSTSYHYIWADADGTEHYFLPIQGASNKYQDEDGLKLTLDTSSTTQLTITDLDKTVRKFAKMSSAPSGTSEAWYLKSITDKNGNTLSFTFDTSYRPTAVKMTPSGSSTQIEHLQISYASNGMPYLIWNPSSKEAVILRYTSTYYVAQIDHAHGNDSVTAQNWLDFYNDSSVKTNITLDASAKYTYSSGHITSVQDTLSGYKISYTYSNGKVSTVQEYGGASSGQKVTLGYYPGYTKARTSGSDDVHGNDDDIITTYSFDNSLRCVSSYSTDINGYIIYGATSGEYVSNNAKAKNSIKTSSNISDIATNYLVNSNFEINGATSLKYWTVSGTVRGLLVGYDEDAEEDTYNLSYYDNSYNVELIAESGDTSSITQTVALKSGKYTLSGAVRNPIDGDITVRLKVQSLDNTSNVYTKEFNFYKNANFAIEAEDSLTFEVDADSAEERFVVGIEIEGGSNTNTTYDYVLLSHLTLSKSVGYSINSKVSYGSFETSAISSGASRYPLGEFWAPCGPSFTSVTTVPHSEFAGNSLYIEGGGIGTERYVKQTIYNVTESEVQYYKSHSYNFIYPKRYRLSGRALSTTALPSDSSSFALTAVVNYMNSDGTIGESQEYSLSFNNYCDSWQFVSGVFQTRANSFVLSIEIRCEFDGQLGSAYFDDVSLCFLGTDSSPTAYDYDSDTGLLTQELSMYSRICYVYDDSDKTKLLMTIDKYSVTEYEYDNKDRVNTVRYYSFAGDWTKENCGYTANSAKTLRSTTTYVYNNYGQQIKETVDSSTGKMVSTKTYKTDSATSKIFGILLSETDALGRTTRYFYDENKGYLLATVGPDGNGTAYTYDGMGRMTLVQPAAVSSSASAGYTANTNAENVSYTYNSAGQLGSIATDSTTYNFTYDSFGNSKSVSVGSQQLASYSYKSNNGKLSTMTYGNGVSVKYDYDELDRVVKIWYKENGASSYVCAYEYKYDADGNVCAFSDHVSDQVTTYRYDSAGRLCQYYVVHADESDSQSELWMDYDNDGRVKSQSYTYDYMHNGSLHTILSDTGISYRTDGMLSSTSTVIGDSDFTTSYTYDILGRQSQIRHTLLPNHGGNGISAVYDYTYSAGSNGGTTSLQISGVKTTVGGSFENYSYTYDDCGRITNIYVGGTLKYSYAYDDLGQLTLERDVDRNKTYTYTYDNAGNILTKSEMGGSSYSYTYGNSSWGDLLTAYRGQTITYDAIGNPLAYYNGSSYAFTWKNGRRLATAVKGSNNLSFTYNDNGIRTSKTVNGITHYYDLMGSQILSESWTDSSGVYHVIIFIYDADGSPIGMSYSNSTYTYGSADNYLFVKNIHGDIIAVYGENGSKLISYTYDAWGNVTTTYHNGGSSTPARFNPFKYRGYYHDSELGFYYLNSRYYDPAIGRFISADGVIAGVGDSVQGYNVFSYGFNNPVNMTDSSGTWPSWNDIKAGFKKAVAWVNNNIIQPVVDFVEDVVEDFDNYDSNNQSEDVVFSSNYFSNYNGVLVVKTPFDTSFSFGFIGLSTQQQNANTLKHEYGHTVQMKNMGICSYITDVAVPSITINILDRKGKLPYDYYSYPWEAEANKFGGVALSQSWKPPLPQGGYTSYWDLIQLFLK